MKNKLLSITLILLAGLALSTWISVQVASAAPWPTATPSATFAPTITPSITNTLTYNQAMATLQIRKLTPTVTPWPTATITLTPTSYLLPSFTPRPTLEASPTSSPLPLPSKTIEPTTAPPENIPAEQEDLSIFGLLFGLVTVFGVAGLLRIAYRNYRRKKMLYQ